MSRLWPFATALLLATAAPTAPTAGGARGVPLAGLCPDGSAFVVRTARDVPCSGARLVESSHLPPLRPELLPKPYGWEIDQRRRDENNPYNLIEAARKLREAAGRTPLETATPAPEAASEIPAVQLRELAVDRQELEDLVRLIALRQEIAPASFRIADAADHEQLWIRLAHSSSFEAMALEQLGLVASQRRVVLFVARAVEPSEFYPNFLISQSGITHRPDPDNPSELEFLVGEPGPLQAGTLALGYFLVPARFDPSGPMDLWWNDRSVHVTLSP